MNTTRILGIETATRICSAAIVSGQDVLAEASLNVQQVHVEKLVLVINQLLDNLHLRYNDVDGIAVSCGPGSFTGVRIGLSVAKGIAFAHSSRLLAVPTLDAIAGKTKSLVDDRTVVPLLHARGEEFYYSAYKLSGDGMQRLSGYNVAEGSSIAEEFEEGVLFAGEGVNTFSKIESVSLKFGASELKYVAASAAEVALIGAQKLTAGDYADLRTLVPLYIKDFVAVKRTKISSV